MILDVALIAQEQPWWCWAASVQMLLEYCNRGTPRYTLPQQCEIVSTGAHNAVACCVDANLNKSECQFGDASAVLDSYGLAHAQKCQSVTFGDLQAEIVAGRPVLFEWNFSSQGQSGFHWMVATGYDIKGGKQYVYINNPSPLGAGSSNWVTYSCFNSSCINVVTGIQLKQTVELAKLAKPGPTLPLLPPPPFLGDPIAKSTGTAQTTLSLALELAGAGNLTAATLDMAVVVYDLPFNRIVDGTLTAYFDWLGNPLMPERPRPSQIIYPVLVGGSLLTAFEVVPDKVHEDDPTWNDCCLGETTTYRRLDDARRVQAQLWNLPLNCYFALTSPQLGLWFVAIKDAQGTGMSTMVTPIQDVPGSTLKAGQAQPFASVASALQQIATPAE